MRRLILLLIPALMGAVWGVGLVVGRRAASAAASARWPLQLGALKDVPARYPKRSASAAALALGPLEARVGIRLNRFDKRPVTVEIEATRKILTLKSQGWPAVAPDLMTSTCADGSWSYANGELAFNRDIPSRRAPFPLRYSATAPRAPAAVAPSSSRSTPPAAR